MNSYFKKNKFKIFLTLISMLILTSSPEVFAVETDDAITRTLCNVIGKLTGPIGKTISTIAIVVLGIGLFLGKLSWAVAVATAIGIGLIFGAGGIVGWIGAGTNTGVTTGDVISEVCPNNK